MNQVPQGDAEGGKNDMIFEAIFSSSGADECKILLGHGCTPFGSSCCEKYLGSVKELCTAAVLSEITAA